MGKLELRHLAPYLPHGLKIQLRSGIKYEMLLCGDSVVLCNEVRGTGGNMWPIYFDDFKPLLIPMSDATITEEVLNETFCGSRRRLKNIVLLGACNYRQFEYMVSHHFDVFGLIEKGLALNKLDTL